MPNPKKISDEPPRKVVAGEEPSADVPDKTPSDDTPQSNQEEKGDVSESTLFLDDPPNGTYDEVIFQIMFDDTNIKISNVLPSISNFQVHQASSSKP